MVRPPARRADGAPAFPIHEKGFKLRKVEGMNESRVPLDVFGAMETDAFKAETRLPPVFIWVGSGGEVVLSRSKIWLL